MEKENIINDFSVKQIIFDTYLEADNILRTLKLHLRDYGVVTLGYLYDLMEWNRDDNEIDCFDDGWWNLDDACIAEDGPNAYRLILRGFGPILRQDNVVKSGKQPWNGRPDKSEDLIHHPAHYQSETGLEALDVIEAFTFDLKGMEAVYTANIFKYMCRWKKKNGLQDLQKAQEYLTLLINHVAKLEEENKKHDN